MQIPVLGGAGGRGSGFMLTTFITTSLDQHCLDHKLVYANKYDHMGQNIARF